MITLIKIGGSLITDKNVQASFRADVMASLARQVRQIRDLQPHQPIIIGHGSGSFGHFEAKQYNTADGVTSTEAWLGFARVAFVASELNRLVLQSLHAEALPALRFAPSSSVLARGKRIETFALAPIQHALTHGLLPVVYGDAVLDTALGGTIASTETVFTYLVEQLPVSKIFLLGEVDGVYDQHGSVIPHLTPANISRYASALKGSEGVDVTGGMLTKVSDMLSLAQSKPNLAIRILNGLTPDALLNALQGQAVGTLITA
jgi:isopentenyl phosphate kinase